MNSEYLCELLDTVRCKSIRDTAEKIINEIYKELWDGNTNMFNSFINLDSLLRELAKDYNVEIKEQ